MSNYKLINPYIEGSLVTTFSGASRLDAACSAWNNLSKYITNNVPKFAFTLENINDGQLYHFLVKESLSGNNAADFKISELDLVLNGNILKQFRNRISLKGGRKHRRHHKDKDEDDDESSSSSSTSEIFSAVRLNKVYSKAQPIVYWWYDPLIYEIDSIYIPTFVTPLVPYIEIMTVNYYP
jgi:hypothetical protein